MVSLFNDIKGHSCRTVGIHYSTHSCGDHHVALSARISLTLFRHPSLSSIASGWSSGLHPVSAQSCCMYVRAGRPAFAHLYEGVHWSISLMSSFLLLQHCPACLVCLILGFNTFSMDITPKNERNNATGVRTRLLRGRSTAL